MIIGMKHLPIVLKVNISWKTLFAILGKEKWLHWFSLQNFNSGVSLTWHTRQSYKYQ